MAYKGQKMLKRIVGGVFGASKVANEILDDLRPLAEAGEKATDSLLDNLGGDVGKKMKKVKRKRR